MLKTFKTQSLDEAVFLTINGIVHQRIRVFGQIHSEWTFPESRKPQYLSKQFWSGTPTVQLDKWIMIRQQLKYEQKNKLAQKKPVKKLPAKKVVDMRHPQGTTYWFINPQGSVQSAFYGKAKSHNERIDAGNFFLNRIQAVNKLNETQST